MRFYIMFLTILSFLLSGCNTRRTVNNMIGNEIQLPNDLYRVKIDCEKIEKDTISLKQNKIIIWFDSTGCNQCRMTGLINLCKAYDYCNDSINGECGFYVIFSPSEEQLNDVINYVWEKKIDMPVLLDIHNEFIQFNPWLPENEKFHSFLLNKKNEIVLVGSPIYNHKMWQLYKSLLK